MNDVQTEAVQDYLKAIYEICERDGHAGTGQIAAELEVAPASVTGMLKKLATADPPLVCYRKHQGAVLTDAGKQQAIQLIRRHRLLECFLHDTLGYSWDEVHEEAERLEHVISGAFDRRMARLLDEPERDPHGSPIPTADLDMPVDSAITLEEAGVGQFVRVQRVSDRDPRLLRYLEKVSLTPGTEVMILPAPPFSDHVRVQHEHTSEPIILGARAAREVFVTVLDGMGEGVAEQSSS